MSFRFYLLLGLLILNFSCQTQKPDSPHRPTMQIYQALLEQETLLSDIPSGSGLVKTGESFFLITDDSPYFFRLSGQPPIVQKFRLNATVDTSYYRIPKLLKPDYESATTLNIGNTTYLAAFGSGSKSPERDSLLLINLHNPNQTVTYALTELYRRIQKENNLSEGNLNIEGAATIGDDLYLLNRGINLAIKINWPELYSSLRGKSVMQAVTIASYRVTLPKTQGFEPGLSGACRLPGSDKLLFCASIENTKSWIEDGEIMGSFIGILDTDRLSEAPLASFAPLTDAQGKPVIEKVESVEWLQQEKSGDLLLMALTDNDLGASKMLKVRLKMKD